MTPPGVLEKRVIPTPLMCAGVLRSLSVSVVSRSDSSFSVCLALTHLLRPRRFRPMSLSTAQAAEALGVTTARVRALVQSGRLQAVRERGRLRDRRRFNRNAAGLFIGPYAAGHVPIDRVGRRRPARRRTAPWITASERSRLKRRLSERPLDPALVRRWLARRANTSTIYGISHRSWNRLLTGFPESCKQPSTSTRLPS